MVVCLLNSVIPMSRSWRLMLSSYRSCPLVRYQVLVRTYVATIACMHAVLTTVNSRTKLNDIINEGGSVLYSRSSRGSRYQAHKLLLLIHQAHALDNPTLRYMYFSCKCSIQSMNSVHNKLHTGIIFMEITTCSNIPCSSEKPFIGTFEVPVTNWRSLALISLS